MSLTLATTPFAPWQSLTPVLDHLGWGWSYMVPGQPGELTSAQLLLHTRPEWAVARALEQGDNPKDTLKVWHKHAEAFLDHFKRHRSSVAVVEVLSAICHPEALIEWLANNHQAFGGVEYASFPTLVKPERPSDLNLMLAAQMVAQASHLPPLIAQLEACSVPLGKSEITHIANVEITLQQLKALSGDAQENQANLIESRKEHKEKERAQQEEAHLLLEQLFYVQEELQRVSVAYEQKDLELEQSIKRVRQLEKQPSAKNSNLQSTKKQHANKKQKSKRPSESEPKAQYRENRPLRASIVLRMRPIVKLFSVNSRKLNADIKLVKSSGLFDAKWYLTQYPDVATSYLSPEEHYVRYGGIEKRSPGPKFDSKQYLDKYPDITESGQNPLIHYLLQAETKEKE